MKSDFIVALTQLAAERNLPREVVLSAIEAALASAYRKDSVTAGQNISVKLDPGSGEVTVFIYKTVVEEVEDDQLELTVEQSKEFKADAEVGDIVNTESFLHNPGRIAAQTAKQVVMQRLREAERDLVFNEYVDREGEVFSVTIQRVEPKQVIVDLGRAEAILPPSEQVAIERYRSGQKLKVLLSEVVRSARGPGLIVSRAHKDLLKRLFEMEVPEIYSGAVEIVAIAREAGSRSKVAVRAKQDGVDPVGSCVGLRGVRIQNIVNELHGEKIDVMEWNKEPAVFVANALSPSQVMRVNLNSVDETATAVVPERQLSLAIGKEGQNARLAAKLTGWKVDIKSNVEWEAERPEVVEPEPVAVVEEPVAEVAPVEPVEAVAELEEAIAVQVEEALEAPVTEPVAEEAIEAVAATEPVVEAESEPAVAEVAVVEDVPAVVEEAEEEIPEPVAEAEAAVIAEDVVPEPVIEEVVEKPVPQPVQRDAPINRPIVRQPVPVGGDRSGPLRDVSPDVWNVRRRSEPEPGVIRFAEDIDDLRGGVTASRRGRSGADNRNAAGGARKKKGGKSGRRRR